MAVVFAQQNRGPGVVDTGARDVRGQIEADRLYVLTLLLDAADLDDPTLTLTEFTLGGARAPGGPWRVFVQGDWTGGVRDRHGERVPPRLTWGSPESTPPRYLRATVTLPRVVRLGLDISFIPIRG